MSLSLLSKENMVLTHDDTHVQKTSAVPQRFCCYGIGKIGNHADTVIEILLVGYFNQCRSLAGAHTTQHFCRSVV